MPTDYWSFEHPLELLNLYFHRRCRSCYYFGVLLTNENVHCKTSIRHTPRKVSNLLSVESRQQNWTSTSKRHSNWHRYQRPPFWNKNLLRAMNFGSVLPSLTSENVYIGPNFVDRMALSWYWPIFRFFMYNFSYPLVRPCIEKVHIIDVENSVRCTASDHDNEVSKHDRFVTVSADGNMFFLHTFCIFVPLPRIIVLSVLK